jgi:hypothetical protein
MHAMPRLFVSRAQAHQASYLLAGKYSPAGTTSAGACVACTSGCEGGTHGSTRAACDAGWTLFTDPNAVEGAASCLQYEATQKTWENARLGCINKRSGAHLLTAKQVRFRGDGSWFTIGQSMAN